MLLNMLMMMYIVVVIRYRDRLMCSEIVSILSNNIASSFVKIVWLTNRYL